MNIAIFELGEIPEEIRDKYPDYPKMIAEWLSPSMPEATFTGISPVRGDKLPPIECLRWIYLLGVTSWSLRRTGLDRTC